MPASSGNVVGEHAISRVAKDQGLEFVLGLGLGLFGFGRSVQHVLLVRRFGVGVLQRHPPSFFIVVTNIVHHPIGRAESAPRVVQFSGNDLGLVQRVVETLYESLVLDSGFLRRTLTFPVDAVEPTQNGTQLVMPQLEGVAVKNNMRSNTRDN